MFNGKMKALTFSYDDGVGQDRRLIEIFNKYGLKSTFNLNSKLLGRKENKGMVCGTFIDRPTAMPEDVKYIYEGHEVAAHTLGHPLLTAIEDDKEVIRQVEKDRENLSELAGYEVTSFAYPCGGVNNDARVARLIKNFTGIKNARTITSTHTFTPPSYIYRLNPTVYFHEEEAKAFELAEKFVKMTTSKPKVFFVWGHSYEFDIHDTWDRFEEFCALLGGHDDICYTTARALNQEEI